MNAWLINETGPVDQNLLEKSLALGSKTTIVRGPAASRTSLAVRLNDIVVHDAKKWFGGADIRLDAIVVQGLPPKTTDLPFYQPSTWRFSGVNSGDRLPVERPGLLVFYGQPAYFLDISVLVSRDRGDTAELSALIARQLNSDDWKAAAASVLGLAMAAPQTAAVTAALAGAAAIGNLAWGILQKATTDTIGLYRVSWLQHRDRFGLGRHPETGSFRQRDLAFWYEIVIDAPR